jgi:hypothetical protein
MTLAIVITALAVFLCDASIGILAVLVAGIRSDDHVQNLRRHLRDHEDDHRPRPDRPSGLSLKTGR